MGDTVGWPVEGKVLRWGALGAHWGIYTALGGGAIFLFGMWGTTWVGEDPERLRSSPEGWRSGRDE